MKRVFEFILAQFAAFASNVSDLLEVVISLPRTLVGGQGQSSLVRRVLLLLFQIVWFPIYAIGWLLLAPLRLFTDFSSQRRMDFLYGLPALFIIGFVSFVSIFVNVQAEEIEKRYREEGQKFMLTQDFAKAKTYLGRVIATNPEGAEDSDLFNWVQILGQTGESERARAVLDKLAPFEKVGYHMAHQLKAINLAQQLNRNKDPMVLRKLRWHLENTRDNTLAINQSWAIYYMAIEQPEKAIEFLEKAAQNNPSNWIDIARIQGQLGNESEQKRAVELAEERFRELVEEDPLNTSSRVKLADALVQLKKTDDAEKVLLTGLRLQADALILRATSDFYVMRHDLAKSNSKSFTEQFEYLRRAMNLDVNYPPIYQRLISLYQTKDENVDLGQVKQAIMESVTSDKPSALGHLALSNVLWMENKGTEAEFHLEQAYNLDPNFVVVLNNLAWTLATKTEPDLDRAYDLSSRVIARVPQDARFRDTYATILMKQGKDEKAVAEFEKALLTIKNKRPLHEKLARLYAKLGRPDLAQMHEEQAALN